MKKIIKTCTCFLEKAVSFVNSPMRYPYWIFLSAVKDVGQKIFVSDERNAFKTVIIILCCLDCVRFEAVQNSKIMQCRDNVKYRFVAADQNPFGESYDDEIFIGKSS